MMPLPPPHGRHLRYVFVCRRASHTKWHTGANNVSVCCMCATALLHSSAANRTALSVFVRQDAITMRCDVAVVVVVVDRKEGAEFVCVCVS